MEKMQAVSRAFQGWQQIDLGLKAKRNSSIADGMHRWEDKSGWVVWHSMDGFFVKAEKASA